MEIVLVYICLKTVKMVLLHLAFSLVYPCICMHVRISVGICLCRWRSSFIYIYSDCELEYLSGTWAWGMAWTGSTGASVSTCLVVGSEACVITHLFMQMLGIKLNKDSSTLPIPIIFPGSTLYFHIYVYSLVREINTNWV